MDIYTGYIVRSNETNPYSVWIPAKNSGGIFKIFKSFGMNTSLFEPLDLVSLQNASEQCYMITEPTAQGPYLYSGDGLATVQEFNPSPNKETIKNVTGQKAVSNRYYSPGNGSIFSPHTLPAQNGLQIYLPGSVDGTTINSYVNAPGGHHTTLDIGTRVLVVYPDRKSVGYIIGQIPFLDETSKIIKDISN